MTFNIPESNFRRVALLGLGRRSDTLYIPYLNSAENQAELVGCSSLFEGESKRLRDAHQIACAFYPLDQLETMVMETEPDLLIIATPDASHAGLIATLADYKIQILVEKPLAATMKDLSYFDNHEHDLTHVSVAHNFRFMNVHQEIHEIISRGSLGVINTVALQYRLNSSHSRSYLERWHRHRSFSGGLEATKSSHHVDLLNYLLSARPLEAMGYSTKRQKYWIEASIPKDLEYIDDTIAATILYDSGATAIYSLTPDARHEGYELRIEGSEGSLRFSYIKGGPGDHRIHVTTRDSDAVIHVNRESGKHDGADARMVDALFHSDVSRFPGIQEGADSLALIRFKLTSFN